MLFVQGILVLRQFGKVFLLSLDNFVNLRRLRKKTTPVILYSYIACGFHGTAVAALISVRSPAQTMIRYLPLANRLLRVSFYLVIISLALLALLPAKKLVTIETSSLLDSQMQAAQDELASVASVSQVAGSLVSREAIYPVPDTAICVAASPVISNHRHRVHPSCPNPHNQVCLTKVRL